VLNVQLKKAFNIYTGKDLKSITIERGMIGRKIGEFIFTRKMGAIHKKKEKIKKSSKK
jgi:ribosomal protein S19